MKNLLVANKSCHLIFFTSRIHIGKHPKLRIMEVQIVNLTILTRWSKKLLYLILTEFISAVKLFFWIVRSKLSDLCNVPESQTLLDRKQFGQFQDQ